MGEEKREGRWEGEGAAGGGRRGEKEEKSQRDKESRG